MQMAWAPLVSVAAPLTVVLPPPAPCRNALPLPPDTDNVPNVRVPAELFCRLTPSVPPVQLVLPNVILAVEPLTKMHCVVLPEIVVEPKEIVPVTEDREIPWAVLLVDVSEVSAEVAAKVPLLRLKAWPLPFSNTSGVVLFPRVSVPKLTLDNFAPVVLPIAIPRTVLPVPKLSPFCAGATVVIVGAAPPVVGSVSLLAGTVTPAMVVSEALAPWPI